ncbi:MAG: GDP-L-fucose synthase family protein [Thermodesulfobacteriota bacterium]
MTPDERIYVAGHRGMVGSAIRRRLAAEGYTRIITRTHAELDLTDQGAVRDFFRSEPIDRVVLAAAKVGGIHANNTYPADFIYRNLMIEANVIHQAFQAGIKRLLFLGSSCIYPQLAPQPMKEEHLLTGHLEPTNEPYAVAKIAGIKLCESYNRQHGADFRSVMPTNLYGPEDNYDLLNSHVLPAMIRKFHLAKLARKKDWDAIEADAAAHGPIPPELREILASADPAVVLWGTGAPRREFLHVDDLAAACRFIMNLPASEYRTHTEPMQSHINIGVGRDVTIAHLAELVQQAVNYDGPVIWDRTKPDGTPRKLLDVSLIHGMGWKARIGLAEGIEGTYDGYGR